MKLDSVEIADSWHKRALGLMFRKHQERPLVMKLGRITLLGANIHCLFMRYPIDVLFLDSEKRIVDKALHVQPWTLSVKPRKPAKYIVEFPTGQAENAEIGEKVEWEE